MSGAGDVNGDGFDDILIGGSGIGPYGESYLIFGAAAGFPSRLNVTGAGTCFVLFGKGSGFSERVSVNSLTGTDGFTLRGEPGSGALSLRDAGDVNGDGLADIILGAKDVAPYGVVSVVFGRPSGSPPVLQLEELNGNDGFRIKTSPTVQNGETLGREVSGAGDINNDGFHDLIFTTVNGSAYVAYGKSTGFPPVLLTADLTGAAGFRIAGGQGVSQVSAAGDLNADGFDDIIVSSFGGPSYVIFGKADDFGMSFSLAELNGTNGFVIPNESAFPLFSSAVRAIVQAM